MQSQSSIEKKLNRNNSYDILPRVEKRYDFITGKDSVLSISQEKKKLQIVKSNNNNYNIYIYYNYY